VSDPKEFAPGHPSQAEGEDRERQGDHPDIQPDGKPSQAEGEDWDRDRPS